VGSKKGGPVLAATWNWVLKDLVGNVAKISVSKSMATRVDRDPKRWRLFGDIVMTMGTSFEIVAPLFPSTYFLLFASLGNLFKKGSNAAYGPAYRVFLNSFAVKNNIGDVSAKAESQVVAGKLVGLGIGISISYAANSSVQELFLAYLALAALHIFCTYKSVSAVQLRTLRGQRLAHILDFICNHENKEMFEELKIETSSNAFSASCPFAMSIRAANASENVFSLAPSTIIHRRTGVPIVLGADGAFVDEAMAPNEVAHMREVFAECRFMATAAGGRAHVFLRADATPDDALVGCLAVYHFLEGEVGVDLEAQGDGVGTWQSSRDFAARVEPRVTPLLRSEGWDVRSIIADSLGFVYETLHEKEE